MAEVWEAVDEVLSRPVAVKVLLPHLADDEAFVTRFRREAIAAARLSDPHIVSIYDTCSRDGVEAIVMELVRGTTLRHLLDERGQLDADQAVDIAAQVAMALEHAHRNGLIHRDVKPGNILLSDDGRVLVADFGIAKAATETSDLTEVGQVVGTAKYLSPEQVRGTPVDGRSDVYALGVVLYEMLCGQAPFVGDSSTATAVARLTSDPPPLRQRCTALEPELDELVLRAIAREPEQRFRTAGDMARALQDFEAGVGRPHGYGVDLTESLASYGATARPGPVADPTPVPGYEVRFAKAERPWLVPAVLLVIIAATLATVALVLNGTGRGSTGGDDADDGPGAEATAAPLTLARATSFDPFGDRSEHDDELGHLVDDDPATVWRTERYNERDFGGGAFKPGVGFVVHLDGAQPLRRLEVRSPTQGWTASAHVSTGTPGSFEEWGPAVDEHVGVPGDATFDLAGQEGDAVLVWFTDVGDGTVGPTYSAQVSGVTVEG